MCDKEYPIQNNSSLLESINKQNFKGNQKGEEPNNCLPTFLIHSLDHIENENNDVNNEKENDENKQNDFQNHIKKDDFNKNNNKRFIGNNKTFPIKKNTKNPNFPYSNNPFDEFNNDFNSNLNFRNGNQFLNKFKNEKNFINNNIQNIPNNININNYLHNIQGNNYLQQNNLFQMFLNFQVMQQMQNLSLQNFNPAMSQLMLMKMLQNQNQNEEKENEEKESQNKSEIFTLNSKTKKTKNQNKKNQNDISNESSISINNILLSSDNEFYSLIITQKGSRELQNLLKKVSEKEIDSILSKLIYQFSDVMIDKYGNYFSQKLIQICNENQRTKILSFIEKRFVEIANNSFGTHPLQSLIELINGEEEKKLALKYINNKICELALDSKGTHVLQKFISRTNDNERNDLNNSIIKNIQMLIDDPFGVCVLIKLIKHTNERKIKQMIINFICDGNILNFIQHPYANYVVQSFLNPNDIILCDKITDIIVENYYDLSMKKFSSNVVENCIKYGDEKIVKIIYKDIMENDKLEYLLNNTYGNFVIEKLIGRLNKNEKNEIIKKIGKEKNLSNTIMNLLYK